MLVHAHRRAAYGGLMHLSWQTRQGPGRADGSSMSLRHSRASRHSTGAAIRCPRLMLRSCRTARSVKPSALLRDLDSFCAAAIIGPARSWRVRRPAQTARWRRLTTDLVLVPTPAGRHASLSCSDSERGLIDAAPVSGRHRSALMSQMFICHSRTVQGEVARLSQALGVRSALWRACLRTRPRTGARQYPSAVLSVVTREGGQAARADQGASAARWHPVA